MKLLINLFCLYSPWIILQKTSSYVIQMKGGDTVGWKMICYYYYSKSSSHIFSFSYFLYRFEKEVIITYFDRNYPGLLPIDHYPILSQLGSILTAGKCDCSRTAPFASSLPSPDYLSDCIGSNHTSVHLRGSEMAAYSSLKAVGGAWGKWFLQQSLHSIDPRLPSKIQNLRRRPNDFLSPLLTSRYF